MPINKGYLTARQTKESDIQFTPDYVVKPLIKYIPPWTNGIWCPFDNDNSAFVRILRAQGYKVIATCLEDGQNFFEYSPDEEYDLIISNPPFSLKDEILARLDELDKPYAMLLPLPTLQGQKRFDNLQGCEILVFDKRISYWQNEERTKMKTQPAFASIFICKNFLPEKLIFERLQDDDT